MSNRISKVAARLMNDYASEVSDAREWPNAENVKRTRRALFAYIASLEEELYVRSSAALKTLQEKAEPARKAFTGGGL